MLLAGDIGGTKTVLALFPLTQYQKDTLKPAHTITYASGKYDSFEAIVATFLTETGVRPAGASFGVAGPVVQGRAEITNLPWVIDTAVIQQKFNLAHVHLLNDLESIANAVPHLQPDELETLNPGQKREGGAIAVIAPGTGLGEAFLVWDGQRYRAYPSEGGHASFGPTNADQRDLLAYLETKYDHVSVERVCSGIGIPNLYKFWRDSSRYPEPNWLRDQLAYASDPNPIIIETGLAGKADICVATLDMFIDILAGEASNMALKVLATGGVYLGGGIPPRILSHLRLSNFMENFTDKGRFTDLVANMPIHVICQPKAALHGAAFFGLDALYEQT